MAGNGNRTYIEPEAVRTAGNKVGGLLSDLSPFERCASAQTQAGNFDAATWLQDQIHARQTDLLSHAVHLKMICGEIKEGLHGVTDELEQADGDNANDLGREAAHHVNVMKYDSHQDGKLADQIAGQPRDWGSQEYDGVSSEFDRTPPPTFE